MATVVVTWVLAQAAAVPDAVTFTKIHVGLSPAGPWADVPLGSLSATFVNVPDGSYTPQVQLSNDAGNYYTEPITGAPFTLVSLPVPGSVTEVSVP